MHIRKRPLETGLFLFYFFFLIHFTHIEHANCILDNNKWNMYNVLK